MILTHLRRNARENFAGLSKKTGIPASTIFDYLKKTDIINKYTCLLNFSKLGFNYWQKTIVKLEGGDSFEFERYLLDHDNVNSVYGVNNNFDYLIETVHHNIKDYLTFIEEIESKFNITKKREIQIINEVKKEGFLTNPRGEIN